jgi:putative membrane protein
MMLSRLFTQFARGFTMGASDVVPGVSGGTVALILGIYNDLISNIGIGSKALGRLVRGDFSGFIDRLRTVDWLFLVPLLAGIGAAVAVLAGVIESALREYPEAMAGLFFGLVIGSIYVARNLLQSANSTHAAVAAGVGLLTFFLLGFQSGPIADPNPIMLVSAGALAICAMILPGISGSFVLLMIGMYASVLDAVNDRNFGQIALIGFGAIIGLALFSSALNHLLERHHDIVMSCLIGLMLGSLRVLWPWPNGVGIIDHDETISGTGLDLPNGAPWIASVLLAVAAAVAVIAISALAQKGTEPAERTRPVQTNTPH